MLMCLILFSYQNHPDYPLVIAANRDEFYQRPTQAAHFWPETPQLLAGKDLQAGGSWMGVTTDGRFAAVTNYRDPGQEAIYPQSRGSLVKDFLTGELNAEEYLLTIDKIHDAFAGFNLLLGTTSELFFYSNQSRKTQKLAPGVYGLSNGHLDEPWPKVSQGKKQLDRILQREFTTDEVIKLLNDRTLAEDTALPNTGVDVGMEKILSAKFIQVPGYGTRSSTVITVDDKQQLSFTEESYDDIGRPKNRVNFKIAFP
jgi:uncharacterized protein with NRDE domain